MWQKLKTGEKLPKSKYKGICSILISKRYILWEANITKNGKRQISRHQTERAAAKRYDMYLIRAGREPVNILKRKT